MTVSHPPVRERPTGLANRISAELAAFCDRRVAELADIDPELVPVADIARDLVLAGGKRLRPVFAYWGWRGAGRPDQPEIHRAVGCLELLHACALVHDDVIDDSENRRGGPSAHRRFSAIHRAGRWHGSAASFGTAGALLLGDLYLVWADQALAECGLPAEALIRARTGYDAMRRELVAGQYLDVLGRAAGRCGVERAVRVARYKSGKYTVERPLRLGAALAGAGPELVEAYSAYGVPLGEAFQLRDDLLGVFGDPGRTGKPAGDDLRDGAVTALVALARDRATPDRRGLIDALLGDRDLDAAGVATLRELIAETGAPDAVESMIAERVDRALVALRDMPVPDGTRAALRGLVARATDRRS